MGHVLEGETAAEAAVSAARTAASSKRFMGFPVVRCVVDDHVPAAQAVGEVKRLVNISGKNRHMQAVARSVREADGLVIVFDGDDRDHRTKRFFTIQKRFGSYVVHNRGLEVEIR